MTNIIQFPQTTSSQFSESIEKDTETMDRALYSFDIAQSGENILMDACLPAELGLRFAAMILEHAEASQQPPKQEKRKRKAAGR